MPTTLKTRRVLLCLALLMTCALAAAEAAAGSTHHLRPLHAADMMSDSVRYGVFEVRPHLIQIVDTRTGRDRRVHVSRRCFPQGATRGVALLSCPQRRGKGRGALLSLATGRIRLIRAYPRGSDFNGIGAEWVSAGDRCGRSRCPDLYVNWHTGAIRRAYGPRDLDSRSLRRDDPRRHDDYREVFGRGDGRARLYVRPAGRRRWRFVHTCHFDCDVEQIVGGVLAYTDNQDELWAYVIATGRSRHWRLSRDVAGSAYYIAPTKTRLFVNFYDVAATYDPTYVGRLP